jgi:hypothetical protein
MDTSPDIAYILGRLSAPLIIGLLVMLFFRVTKKRHLNAKEKKIVIWVVVIGYVLMALSAIARAGNSGSY